MGKGNPMVGTARGKYGDMIFYRTGGEQRFRVRVKPMNPRTNAQLLQRVIMSTVSKAYTDLITVCDHAFQNFEGKMRNQQRFLKLNAKLMRGIALNNVTSWSPIRWTNTNYGNWLPKDSIQSVVNPLIISEGDIQPVAFNIIKSNGKNRVTVGNPFTTTNDGDYTKFTYSKMCEVFGCEPGDQVTFVWQICSITGYPIVRRTMISRVIMMPSNGNMDEAFFVNNDTEHTINMPNKENYGNIYFRGTNPSGDDNTERHLMPFYMNDLETMDSIGAYGVIVSRFENNYWRRSNTQMVVTEELQNVMTMKNAVASFEKDTTSSLYLNQATTASTNNFKATEGYGIEPTNYEDKDIDMDEEEEPKTRKKKQ